MGLTQSRLANANYHAAADDWLALVQFKDVADDVLPRVYLAWPFEIAAQLKAASGGRGDIQSGRNIILAALRRQAREPSNVSPTHGACRENVSNNC